MPVIVRGVTEYAESYIRGHHKSQGRRRRPWRRMGNRAADGNTTEEKGEISVKLLFKQRFFTWFDSYDIYDEDGNTVYVVKGQLSWGHCLKIFDVFGNEIGMVQERIFTLLPKFEMYAGGQYIGCISKEFTLFKPKYNIDCNGWQIEGSFFEWDYRILNRAGACIAQISKQLFNWTDTYMIDVQDPEDSLCALMLVLAIDAEKCSRQ